MRQMILVVLLLFSTSSMIFTDFVEKQAESESEIIVIPEKWNSANGQNDCGVESYSPAVRAAFAQVEDLGQYSQKQLEESRGWVAVIPSFDCSIDSIWLTENL